MRRCKEEPLSSSDLPYSELVAGADPTIRDAVMLDIGLSKAHFMLQATFREQFPWVFQCHLNFVLE